MTLGVEGTTAVRACARCGWPSRAARAFLAAEAVLRSGLRTPGITFRAFLGQVLQRGPGCRDAVRLTCI